jgi:hypothetical protein
MSQLALGKDGSARHFKRVPLRAIATRALDPRYPPACAERCDNPSLEKIESGSRNFLALADALPHSIFYTAYLAAEMSHK